MEDKTLFVKQFKQITEELSPAICKVIEENDFGDNAILFYFASVVREVLKKTDDKEMKEAVIRFMLD